MKKYMSYVMLLLFVTLSGCAPKGMLRPDQDVYMQEDKEGGYRLAFIEIDDQGHFYDRKQVNDVLNFIREGEKDKNIILYVHGWHHNAEEDDGNLDQFRELLQNSNKYSGKETVGIYIGWRGESVNLPGIEHLTFWDRKNTSEEVGQGALIEFLVRVEQISDEIEAHLITIGHSFGASVVLSSIKSLLIERIAKQKTGDNAVGFGNLVVLVNPAIEAIQYAPFRDIVEERERGDELQYRAGQPPRIIIATSESDFPNKVLFRIGRTLSTLFEYQRDIERKNRIKDDGKNTEVLSQDTMDKTTVAFYEPFITHRLDAIGNFDLRLDNCEPIKLPVHHGPPKKPPVLKEGWKLPLKFGKNEEHEMILEHLSKSSPYNPYWIVEVDEDIIPGHNEILKGNFLCFIRKFLPYDYNK